MPVFVAHALWGRLLTFGGFLIRLLCGAANPGCSRLSAGSPHLCARRFLPPETFPSRDRLPLASTRPRLSCPFPKAFLTRNAPLLRLRVREISGVHKSGRRSFRGTSLAAETGRHTVEKAG